jgi:branched-chain amino acid transport system substrate-binding protein
MRHSKVSRRKFLGTLGAASTIAAAGCLDDSGNGNGNGGNGNGNGGNGNGGNGNGNGGNGNGNGTVTGTPESVSGTFSVGLLQDFSGPLPDYGAQGTTGFYSGLAYKADDDPLGSDAVDEGDYEYSVGDIDVEIHARDTQFNPTQAQELATDLVSEQEVDLLYGVGNSNGASRVINQVVDRTNVPYIAGPAASASITNSPETCRERVFRANENTAMDARSGGVYIAEETEVDQIALFGADYSFGRAVVENYKQVLQNRGVEIVLERFVDRGYAEWPGLLEQAQEAGAQGMVGGFTAQTLIPFASSFLEGDYDMRLFGGFATRVTLTPVGSTLSDVLGENFTNEGLANANFGPFTTRYHWNQYDNAINDQFVQDHRDAYDMVPDLFTSGAFTAASAAIEALRNEGEVGSDALVAGMTGLTVTDTPKGENGYQFQEYNNQARSAMTVAPVEVTPDSEGDWPAAIQPGEPIETISADQVTIPAEDVECDLA